MRAVLQSSGQNCAGAERFYVHKDIYSSFVNQVSKIVKSVSAVSMPLSTYFIELVFLRQFYDLCFIHVLNELLNSSTEC